MNPWILMKVPHFLKIVSIFYGQNVIYLVPSSIQGIEQGSDRIGSFSFYKIS